MKPDASQTVAQPRTVEDLSMSDIFSRLGLRRVINVSGTETPLGAAPVCPEVMDAVVNLVPHSVYMAELQSAACATIARATGAEAGCVTGCTAAGIAVSVAACMTGRNLALVEQLPDTTGMKDEVVMQKGHDITYVHHVTQNVHLTGARVVSIGAATQCGIYQLRHALGPRTVAALYVVSHLTVQERLIELEDYCRVCHDADVPVIVDAASQSDPRRYLQAGADLVLFSAHKSFASLTAGVIAGRLDLVQSCMYQEHGIGRPMKVGKEGVIAVIAALERWLAEDKGATRRALDARLERARARLSEIPGLHIERHGTSQLALRVEPDAAGLTAHVLDRCLRDQEPSIVLWNHRAPAGSLLLNLSKVSDETADYVTQRIAEVFAARPTSKSKPANLADELAASLERWPLTGAHSKDY
jgi:D-glucosaminate-6-phosphate ammonia-lyase